MKNHLLVNHLTIEHYADLMDVTEKEVRDAIESGHIIPARVGMEELEMIDYKKYAGYQFTGAKPENLKIRNWIHRLLKECGN